MRPTLSPRELGQARKTAVVGAVIGGMLEWYDFAVYAFMAGHIARTFFPAGDSRISILTALAVFGVGFLARPVGALVIGRIGDIYGRRASLILCISLMTIGTVAIGALPGYRQLGITAPVLVVIARLMQGFSIGGEWGNSVAFLVEWAPRKRRGLYGSLVSCIGLSGLPLGSGVAALVTMIVPAAQMSLWGWRLPFLLTLILGPVGYILRRRTAETPEFQRLATGGAKRNWDTEPTDVVLRAIKAFCLTVAFTVATYMFLVFMPSFASNYGRIDSATALWVNTAAGLLSMMLFVPLFGLLSDLTGRKPQLVLSCAAFVVLPYPLLSFVLHGVSGWMLFLFQLVLNLPLASCGAVVPPTLAELFPIRIRTTWMSAVFALAVAIFGGFAAFIATWLVGVTGQAIAPAFYIIAAGLVGVVAAVSIPETFWRAEQVRGHAE